MVSRKQIQEPYVSRDDEFIHLTRGMNHISIPGDGLGPFEQLMLKGAINSKQDCITQIWRDNLNKSGHSEIQNSLIKKENKIKHLKEYLSLEIDKLPKIVEEMEKRLREVYKNSRLFLNLTEASEATANIRKSYEDDDPNDYLNNLLNGERKLEASAEIEVKQMGRELSEWIEKLLAARRDLLSNFTVENKHVNVIKRCQNSEKLISYPYIPQEDDSKYQEFDSRDDKLWEEFFLIKINYCQRLSEEASKYSSKVIETIRETRSKLIDAWEKTSKALMESVEKCGKVTFSIKIHLRELDQSIKATKQRLENFENDMKAESECRSHVQWRMQTLSYRPGQDHIRDKPFEKLQTRKNVTENTLDYVWDNLNENKQILRQLIEQKARHAANLHKLSEKTFMERNCLNIRKIIPLKEWEVAEN